MALDRPLGNYLPQWSPDGQRFASSRRRGGDQICGYGDGDSVLRLDDGRRWAAPDLYDWITDGVYLVATSTIVTEHDQVDRVGRQRGTGNHCRRWREPGVAAMRTQSAVLLSAGTCPHRLPRRQRSARAARGSLPPTPFVVSNPAVAGGGVKSAGGRSRLHPSGRNDLCVAPRVRPSLDATGSHDPETWRWGLVVAPVVSGVDPLPIAATPGDTLEVVVDRVADLDPLRYRMLVPEKSPPIVVRTEPQDGEAGRAVPNAAIIIVFSEPIDSGTVNGTTLLLRAGTTVLGGAIRFCRPSAPGRGTNAQCGLGPGDILRGSRHAGRSGSGRGSHG